MVKDVHCKDIAAIFNINPSGVLNRWQVQIVINNYKNTHVCERCGSNKHLQFHHIDPTKKIINIGDFFWKKHRIYIWSLTREMRKCELLCKDCHNKIHYLNKKEE